EQRPDDVYRDHVGIHPQKQVGCSYVGAAVLRGRITADQMRKAADLAEELATGELRTTNMQNLLIVNVPSRNVEILAQGLEAAGVWRVKFRTRLSVFCSAIFRRDCPGRICGNSSPATATRNCASAWLADSWPPSPGMLLRDVCRMQLRVKE